MGVSDGRTKSGAIKLSRRSLLKMATAGAAGIWVGQLTPPRASAQSDSARVVVLGGGLAGLTAAYELTLRGHDVIVLETQYRAGGRVYSSTAGLVQGQVAEFGATRIPSIHDLTLHYANEFGLSLDVFPASRTQYLVAGKQFFPPETGELWPLNLSPEEQEYGPGYPARRLRASSPAWVQATSPLWPPAKLIRGYDQYTIVSWLTSIGASADMIKLYTAANSSRGSVVGALMEGAQEVLMEDAASFSHIRGGNENLPRALAEALGPRVRFGTSVVGIERHANYVTVEARGASGPVILSADHVVCALPPTILRSIPIRPALPEQTARAIASVNLSAAWKTIIQTQSRFWNNDGMEGLVVVGTDTPAERVWDVSSVQQGSCGLLHQYVATHQPAFDGKTAAQRRQMVTAYLAPALPQLQQPGEVLYWKEFHWDQQPWVRGGISGILPNQAWMYRVLPLPVGRLHFAGDHTTIWAGWMQGAIQSGLRAAQEIDPSIGFLAAA